MGKEMRIVGWTPGNLVVIQEKGKGEWIQSTVTETEFNLIMQHNYPKYWNEWMSKERVQTPMDFFWNYHEDPEMRRKGEAFIFS